MPRTNEEKTASMYDRKAKRDRRPAGCWGTAIHLSFITLLLLACSAATAVQKFAEPIDRIGCETDCRAADFTFSRYEYHHHACYCLDSQGQEIELYRLIPK